MAKRSPTAHDQLCASAVVPVAVAVELLDASRLVYGQPFSANPALCAHREITGRLHRGWREPLLRSASGEAFDELVDVVLDENRPESNKVWGSTLSSAFSQRARPITDVSAARLAACLERLPATEVASRTKCASALVAAGGGRFGDRLRLAALADQQTRLRLVLASGLRGDDALGVLAGPAATPRTTADFQALSLLTVADGRLAGELAQRLGAPGATMPALRFVATLGALRVWGSAPQAMSRAARTFDRLISTPPSTAPLAGLRSSPAIAALEAQRDDPTGPGSWARLVDALFDSWDVGVDLRGRSVPWSGWFDSLVDTSAAEVRAACCGVRPADGSAASLLWCEPASAADHDAALDARLGAALGADVDAWRPAFALSEGSTLPLDEVLALVATADV